MARILLVDENPVTRALSRKCLLLARHHVLDATSGAAALEVLAHAEVDLVVVDLALPDMAGTEAIERLRATVPGVPLIVLSEREETDPQLLAMLAGSARVKKPASPHELTEAVDRAVAAAAELARGVITLPEEERAGS